MVDLSKHYLIQQAYHVCLAIEECGASEKLTNASTKASQLLEDIEDYIDSRAWSNKMVQAEINADKKLEKKMIEAGF